MIPLKEIKDYCRGEGYEVYRTSNGFVCLLAEFLEQSLDDLIIKKIADAEDLSGTGRSFSWGEARTRNLTDKEIQDIEESTTEEEVIEGLSSRTSIDFGKRRHYYPTAAKAWRDCYKIIK